MERKTEIRAGYDCIRKPCGVDGCGANPNTSHGVHCDEWWYTVANGAFALTLSVFSHVFPASVPTAQTGGEPEGATLTLHAPFPTNREEIDQERECEHLPGGKCYGFHHSFIAARDFFKTFGVPLVEQRESFWEALESELLARSVAFLEDRHAIGRCDHCNGSGVRSLEGG